MHRVSLPLFSLSLLLLVLLPSLHVRAAEPEFPLTEDSKPKPEVPKGLLIKDTFKAWGRHRELVDGHTIQLESLFPGTEREYTLYLPHGFDRTKPTPFMVFQDGVIYQAPVVLDNLIARKEVPPLVGVFVRPGIVPAESEKALPRFNRSHEYDSVTDAYATFLLEELLPAIERDHEIKFSTDPNDTAIAGNSSGGIAAFMVAWHRPDRFRRVFTGVGTYVGIHGGDQLPVLVRKVEPKPLRIFLQSGTGDNNLYCGDWWMANQMMERSLTWAGYDVNHAWGEGGHNAKHATQIFPDVLRWLWKGWQESKELKANPRGDSQWKGMAVVGAGEWVPVHKMPVEMTPPQRRLTPKADGSVYFEGPGLRREDGQWRSRIYKMQPTGEVIPIPGDWGLLMAMAMGPDGALRLATREIGDDGRKNPTIIEVSDQGQLPTSPIELLEVPNHGVPQPSHMAYDREGRCFFTDTSEATLFCMSPQGVVDSARGHVGSMGPNGHVCLSPDQTTVYSGGYGRNDCFWAFQIEKGEGFVQHGQPFGDTQHDLTQGASGGEGVGAMCVDTNGWIYVTTPMGVQVLDQCGRTNFIIATPEPPRDVCFGGKDLSQLIISCGDHLGVTLYKRQTTARGVVSAQMPPIKPTAPRL